MKESLQQMDRSKQTAARQRLAGKDSCRAAGERRKEISSATETGEDWQQGRQRTVPPESHPWVLKYRDEAVLTAIPNGSVYLRFEMSSKHQQYLQ